MYTTKKQALKKAITSNNHRTRSKNHNMCKITHLMSKKFCDLEINLENRLNEYCYRLVSILVDVRGESMEKIDFSCISLSIFLGVGL